MAFGGKVQENGGSIAGSSFSATLGSAITAGNLVCIKVIANNVPSGTNAGWTKSTGCSPVANAQGLLWWFIAVGGDTIPSITFAGATTGAWRIIEYEGPFDASPYLTSAGAATNGAISSIASSSITPTSGVGALVIAGLGGQSGADASWNIASNALGSFTNSFTNASQQWRQAATEAHLACQVSLVVGSTTGSYTTTGTPTTSSTSGGSCRTGITIAFKQGATGIAGTGSPTDPNETLASTGTVVTFGVGATTDPVETLAATGTLPIRGTAAVNDNDDVAGGAGTLINNGVLNATDPNDTLTATGTAGNPPIAFDAAVSDTTQNGTTSMTLTLPTVAVGTLIVIPTINRDSVTVPTVTDDDTGGNTWSRKTTESNRTHVWYKYATSGTSGKTVTISGATGSVAAGLATYLNTIGSGDPFGAYVRSANASGVETQTGITPDTDGCMVLFVVGNRNDDNVVSGVSAVNTGAFTTRVDSRSTGGSDCAIYMGDQLQTTAAATGDISWAQTNGGTDSIAMFIKPVPTGGSAINGVGSISDPNDTLVATGTLPLAAASTATDANDTLAATGTLPIFGAASITDSNDTAAGAGGLVVYGQATIADPNDTLAATGTLPLAGTGSATDPVETLSSAGNLPINGSLGRAPPTSLLMSSRLNQMGYAAYAGSDGTDLDSNTRLSLFNETGATVTALRMYFQNARATATNEADGYNTITIKASLEYPAGTFTALTFGGNSSIALAAGAALGESDELTGLSIPADAQFWVRTYVSVTSGQKWVQGYTIATGRGEAVDFGTASDKTLGGTITNATATATRRGYGPSAIKATGFSGRPRSMAWAAIGDSLVQGVGGLIDARGNTGYIGMAMSWRYPYLNIGYTGTRAADNVPANLSRRKALILAAGITDLIVEYGINDINTSRSSAQTLVDLAAIHAEFTAAGIRVWQTTITPMATSTDQFDTVANQTVKSTPSNVFTGGSSGVRGVLNAAIRAVPSPLSGYVEFGDASETSRDSGIFKTGADSGNPHLRAPAALTVGAGATTTAIPYSPPLAANALAFGGVIVFTSGALAGTRVAVNSMTTTQINVTAMASAPANGDTMTGYFVAGRFTGDGTHSLATSFSPPEDYGGQFILRDVMAAKLYELEYYNDPNDTLAAFGGANSGVTGTGSPTDPNDTLAATGTSPRNGVGAIDDPNDTAGGAGALINNGVLNATDANDTLVATGASPRNATGSPVDPVETLAATATIRNFGVGAILDPNDSLIGTGTVPSSGVGAISDPNDTLAATGAKSVPALQHAPADRLYSVPAEERGFDVAVSSRLQEQAVEQRVYDVTSENRIAA